MLFTDRCQFCRSEIQYDDQGTDLRCPACGSINLVVRFKREQKKLEEAEKKAAEARDQAETAQKARDEAEKRLNETLRDLGTLSESQKSEEELVRRIFDEQAFTNIHLDGLEENQKAVRDLIHEVLAGQEKMDGKQDALRDIMTALMQGQDDTADRLQALKSFADRIHETQKAVHGDLRQFQNETGAAFQDLRKHFSEQLQQSRLDVSRQTELLRTFMQWAKDVQQDDLTRLDRISSSADTISRCQLAIQQSVTSLRGDVKHFEQSFMSFRDQLEQHNQERLLKMHSQASDDYASRRFEKADELYESIAYETQQENLPDLLWYRFLCHFGIAYTGRTPVIYKPDLKPFDTIFAWKRLQNTLDNRPEKERIQETVQMIRSQLKEMRAAKNSPADAYDLFLCCSRDSSAKAKELKALLEHEGLRVFCSPESALLPEMKRNEGYVLHALQQAKAMILVARQARELLIPSIRSQWLRYQWLMQTQGGERNLLCCIPESELPRLNDPAMEELYAHTPVPYVFSLKEAHTYLDPLFPLFAANNLLKQNSVGLASSDLQKMMEMFSGILSNQTAGLKPQPAGQEKETEREPDYEEQLAQIKAELARLQAEQLPPVREHQVVSFRHTAELFDTRLKKIDRIRSQIKTIKGQLSAEDCQRLAVRDCEQQALKLRTDTGSLKMHLIKAEKNLKDKNTEYIMNQDRAPIPRETIYIRRSLEVLRVRESDLHRLGIADDDPLYIMCEKQIRRLEAAL